MGSTHAERVARRRRLRRHNQQTAPMIQVRWDAYTHEQLYDKIMVAKPEVMAHRADQWMRLADRIEDTTRDVEQTIQRLLGSWRGQAAVSAAESNSKLTRWAGEASHTAAQIGAGMGRYTDAVAEAQARMPEPVFSYADRAFRSGDSVTVSEGPSGAIAIDQMLNDRAETVAARESAHREAIKVMEKYEAQSRDVHHDLPSFRPAPTLPPPSGTQGPPQQQPPPPPPWPPPDQTPPNQTPPGQDPSGTGAGPNGTTTPSFVDPATGPGPGQGGDGSRSGVGPGFGGSGPGSGADSTRGGPGIGSGVGPVGGGGTAGGPGARGAGSAAGVGPVAARGGGGAAGVAGARGGAGGPGGLYPPVAGAGAQGDKDKEHKNKYGEGLDLLDDLPPAYPPVFGA